MKPTGRSALLSAPLLLLLLPAVSQTQIKSKSVFEAFEAAFNVQLRFTRGTRCRTLYLPKAGTVVWARASWSEGAGDHLEADLAAIASDVACERPVLFHDANLHSPSLHVRLGWLRTPGNFLACPQPRGHSFSAVRRLL